MFFFSFVIDNNLYLNINEVSYFKLRLKKPCYHKKIVDPPGAVRVGIIIKNTPYINVDIIYIFQGKHLKTNLMLGTPLHPATHTLECVSFYILQRKFIQTNLESKPHCLRQRTAIWELLCRI